MPDTYNPNLSERNPTGGTYGVPNLYASGGSSTQPVSSGQGTGFSTNIVPYSSNPTAVTQNNPNFSTNDKPSPFNIPSFAQPFDYQGQRDAANNLIGNYAGFIKSQETVPQLYDRISNQLQLPQQRENVQRYNELSGDLTSQLEGLPQQVAGTTQNSLVTDAQRSGIVQNRQIPLALSLGQVGRLGEQAGTRLTASEQELGNRMNMSQAQQQKELLPWEKQFNELDQQQAREFSGYTFSNQLELNRLISNQQTGYHWTTDEAERANKLALAEWQYRTALDSIKEQGNQTRITNSQDIARTWGALSGSTFRF